MSTLPLLPFLTRLRRTVHNREPVIVHIDRVFLLAAPNEDVGEDDPEKKQQQLANKKRRAIEDAERNWLAKRSERDAAKADGGKDGGFIKNYIDIILGNLQLCIEHVHVRFEARFVFQALRFQHDANFSPKEPPLFSLRRVLAFCHRRTLRLQNAKNGSRPALKTVSLPHVSRASSRRWTTPSRPRRASRWA